MVQGRDGGISSRGRVQGQGQRRNNEETDIVTLVANLQRQLDEQQAKIVDLRQQLKLQNQNNEETRTEDESDREEKHDYEDNENGNDQDEVAHHQQQQPTQKQALVQQEPLYVRFQRMHPPEFNGVTNPLVAEEWLSSIQVVLEFMNLMDLEKILCASYVLKMDA